MKNVFTSIFFIFLLAGVELSQTNSRDIDSLLIGINALPVAEQVDSLISSLQRLRPHDIIKSFDLYDIAIKIAKKKTNLKKR